MDNILDCNLELCLSPPSSSSSSSSSPSSAAADSTSPCNNIARTRLPITDLTELQARAIIERATRQMEAERRWTTCRISSPTEQQSMKSGANPSMRRSLQRFLQKRKNRIQTLSPYTH